MVMWASGVKIYFLDLRPLIRQSKATELFKIFILLSVELNTTDTTHLRCKLGLAHAL